MLLEGVVFVLCCSVCGKKFRGRWDVKTFPSGGAIETFGEWIVREIAENHVCELK